MLPALRVHESRRPWSITGTRPAAGSRVSTQRADCFQHIGRPSGASSFKRVTPRLNDDRKVSLIFLSCVSRDYTHCTAFLLRGRVVSCAHLSFSPRFPVAPLPAPFFFRARAPSTRRVPQFLALAPEGQAAPIFPTRTSFPKPARAIFLCSVHNFPSHPDCLGLGTQPQSPHLHILVMALRLLSSSSLRFVLSFRWPGLPYDDAYEGSLAHTVFNRN
jgi:hypothetical protein